MLTRLVGQAEPGDMAGKEGKHVPVVEVQDGSVSITVPHGMSEEHFIEYIWAKNQDGDLIHAVKLTPADTPQTSFSAPDGTTSVTALESCNLHGTARRLCRVSPHSPAS
jgi:desulfoferrodoxin-like iron-binding protein